MKYKKKKNREDESDLWACPSCGMTSIYPYNVPRHMRDIHGDYGTPVPRRSIEQPAMSEEFALGTQPSVLPGHSYARWPQPFRLTTKQNRPKRPTLAERCYEKIEDEYVDGIRRRAGQLFNPSPLNFFVPIPSVGPAPPQYPIPFDGHIPFGLKEDKCDKCDLPVVTTYCFSYAGSVELLRCHQCISDTQVQQQPNNQNVDRRVIKDYEKRLPQIFNDGMQKAWLDDQTTLCVFPIPENLWSSGPETLHAISLRHPTIKGTGVALAFIPNDCIGLNFSSLDECHWVSRALEYPRIIVTPREKDEFKALAGNSTFGFFKTKVEDKVQIFLLVLSNIEWGPPARKVSPQVLSISHIKIVYRILTIVYGSQYCDQLQHIQNRTLIKWISLPYSMINDAIKGKTKGYSTPHDAAKATMINYITVNYPGLTLDAFLIIWGNEIGD